jgi:hypothetical protein
MPNSVDLKILIMVEVHRKSYSSNLGYQKTITVGNCIFIYVKGITG